MKIVLLTYVEAPDEDFDLSTVASLASIVKDLVSSVMPGGPGATCLRVGCDEVPIADLLKSAHDGVGASMTRASHGDTSTRVAFQLIGPTKES